MTDEKKGPGEGGDIDWDSALSDWESKHFVPEVARDVVTDKPAALSGHSVSRPLYRPPKVSPAKPKGLAAPPVAHPPATETVADDGEASEETVIGVVPRESLRRGSEPSALDPRSKARGDAPAPATSHSRGGGLGQLFAREDRRGATRGTQRDADSRSATRARGDFPADAVTSSGATRHDAERSGVGPLRAPTGSGADYAAGDDVAEVEDDDLFDSFVEPRNELLTIPAESELDDFFPEPVSESGARRDGPATLVPDALRDEGTAAGDGGLQHVDINVAPSPRAALDVGDRDDAPFPSDRVPVLPGQASTQAWEDERPASAWLDAPTLAAFRERAAWLEEEARAMTDAIGRGRGLLACSEMLATVGDRERAEALAFEARDLAPSVALAHRQARGLLPSRLVPGALLEALDLEIKMTPVGPARAHAMRLSVDAAGAEGDDDATGRRIEQASRVAPNDVGIAVRRAARVLSSPDSSGAVALRFAGGRDLSAIAEALQTCLRLRGVAIPHAAASQPSSSELLLRARQALDKRDVSAAATILAELAREAELANGAMWLASALGAIRGDRRAQASQWLAALVDQGVEGARRPLAARALELSDARLLTQAIERPGPLGAPERLVLAALSGVGIRGPAAEALIASTASVRGMQALATAAAAIALPDLRDAQRSERARTRARQTSGAPDSKALTELGRMLGAGAAAEDVESTLDRIGTMATAPGAARAVALEMASRAARVGDVSAAFEAWGAERREADDRAQGALAAAIIAERAGDTAGALRAFKAARSADPTCEAALRAIASLEPVDMFAEMNALADELGDGPRAAIARLEAVTLGEGVLPEPTQAHLLETAHRAAPGIPIAAFLAERIARRSGDIDEVLRCIRARRAESIDATESALDAVREALLVADRNPALAAERLGEAHRARPADVSLRELFERMSADPPNDRAAWREGRAEEATGAARVLLLLDAALEYERKGDEESALRCAERAASYDAALGRVARERAELRTGRVARLADELFSEAKNAEDARRRREAFERLADLDLNARHDSGSALLWHRSIFEDQPGYKPSLRYLEQHLVDEGRDEELEPVASAIAIALRGTDSPETVAHAELAARLRMRGAAGSWESTREMVQVAAAEREPSLWSLRMLQSHARTMGDEEGFLAVTKRLIERGSRPAEIATLLVRAAEAAARLGRLDEARGLLERATAEDPGDIVAWELLTVARQSAGDRRGAAEASESIARSSAVAERQVAAWYEAARLWQEDREFATASSDAAHRRPGDPDDDARGIAALEAAATIDVAYKDVFDRLSRVYATRKMQPELADLLERRMECVTDPDERLIIEVQRGRVLFEAGDPAGARDAYESALEQQPDDAPALAALTDLCLAEGDWEVAEQALIRLARLLSTPAEQRVVYTQLGELYSRHLVNLPRAEVALKQVLECAPGDVETMVRLVDVYRRQNDAARAIELQQQLVQRSQSSEEKRRRVIELASIHEQTAHDNRKAEQTLETARREFPQDANLLRALAEFYTRHHQAPAVAMLLERAAADARRALTAGRLTPASFEVLAAVFDLRGLADAARVTQAMLATLAGEPAELRGAGAVAAFETSLDDLLAPEALTAPLRWLLAKTGAALDAVAPVDLRAIKAAPLPSGESETRVTRDILRAATAIGLGNLTLLSSPKLGPVCIPVSSSPPTIVIGQALLTDEHIGLFLGLRALKLVRANASALGRTVPGELGILVSAWLNCLNPNWLPQGINPTAIATAVGRIQAALPRNLPADIGAIALEVANAIGTRQATLGPAALAWANRVAFLALGDPNSALNALASAGAPGAVGLAGPPRTAPRDPRERAAWVARTPEARDLVAFGVTEAFAETRARLGLDR